jgi:hypothetical protein
VKRAPAVLLPAAAWAAVWACGAWLLPGCHHGPVPATADGGGLDARASDASAPLIDVAVTGCASLDLSGPVCRGTAPLTVTFSPVGSPGLTTFLWRFGDGSPPVSDHAPVHTYTLPGVYDVSVTGEWTNGSSVSDVHRGLIDVRPVGAGGPCDVTDQCAGGLSCLCAAGSGCAAGFSRGVCSTVCTTGFCGDGAVCVAYPLPAPGAPAGDQAPDGGAATWSPICLADCGDGSPCPAGFACASFHAGGMGAAGWVKGCLPTGVAAELGASCRNANGDLDNTACASGYCGAFGVNGLCSASCQPPLTCPAGAACARVGAAQVCLAPCSTTVPCSSDPGTTCRLASPADAGADAGLALVSGDPSQAYCAPR